MAKEFFYPSLYDAEYTINISLPHRTSFVGADSKASSLKKNPIYKLATMSETGEPKAAPYFCLIEVPLVAEIPFPQGLTLNFNMSCITSTASSVGTQVKREDTSKWTNN